MPSLFRRTSGRGRQRTPSQENINLDEEHGTQSSAQMSGVEEALIFSRGGDYTTSVKGLDFLGDDSEDEEVVTSTTVTEMDSREDEYEYDQMTARTRSMGTPMKYASRPSPVFGARNMTRVRMPTPLSGARNKEYGSMGTPMKYIDRTLERGDNSNEFDRTMNERTLERREDSNEFDRTMAEFYAAENRLKAMHEQRVEMQTYAERIDEKYKDERLQPCEMMDMTKAKEAALKQEIVKQELRIKELLLIKEDKKDSLGEDEHRKLEEAIQNEEERLRSLQEAHRTVEAEFADLKGHLAALDEEKCHEKDAIGKALKEVLQAIEEQKHRVDEIGEKLNMMQEVSSADRGHKSAAHGDEMRKIITEREEEERMREEAYRERERQQKEWEEEAQRRREEEARRRDEEAFRERERQQREEEEMQRRREEEARRRNRKLLPEEVALLGALPREIPNVKAEIDVLEDELKALRAKVDQVVRPINSGNLHTTPGHGPPNSTDQRDSGADCSTASSESDMNEVHERTKRVIQTTEEKNRMLKANITAKEAKLADLREKVASHPKVVRAQEIYRNDKNRFIDSMFNCIQQGKLSDLAILTAAANMEGLCNLDKIHHKSSKLTVLHLALMTKKNDIVDFLLNHSGKHLAKASINTTECDNLTPLYIAMQNMDVDNVVKLVRSVPEENEERKNYVNQLVPNYAIEDTPYNELPLAGCVWGSLGEDRRPKLQRMLTFLIENNADLELATSTGDTLLHLLVLQAVESIEHLDYLRDFLKNTFKKAVGVWWLKSEHSSGNETAEVAQIYGMKYLMNVKNNEDLIPMALAAKVESPLYMDLVNWEDVMRYPDLKTGQQFSSVDTYDISSITSQLRPTEKGYKYNQFSVMHVLAHNNQSLASKAWNVDIACMEPLQTIIGQKWSVYKYIVYLWLIIHAVHMISFTFIPFLAAANKPNSSSAQNGTSVNVSDNSTQNTSDNLESKPGNPYFAFFLILPLTYIILELIDISIARQKFQFHVSLIGNAVYRIIILIFSVFTIIWFVLHMLANENQDIFLSLVNLLGWLFVIFFTRTINFPGRSSQIGAFSIMVQRMLFNDLLPFFLVSFFVVVAFSGAIHATMLHLDEPPKFADTLFDMLKYYSALDGEQGYDSSRVLEFGKALLTVYGIISVVLLINMLIAAMGKTYEMVRETKTNLVVRQRLAIILLIERRLPWTWLLSKADKHVHCMLNRRERKHESFIKVVSKTPITSLMTN